jgi:pimeloyl-ACP methyl ester carboxylesterase
LERIILNVNVNGLNINYEVLGKDNENEVLILHGWGANLASFAPVAIHLSQKFKVYSIDFPGFGKSDEPDSSYTVTDYAKLVLEFIKKMNIQNPTLIGHSFGGRVIIKLVAELGFTPKNIIFVDSAGIKPKRSLKYYFKVYSYKLTKKIIYLFNSKEKAEKIIKELRKNAGSSDYNAASETMKKVFINVVNEDLKSYLPKIKVPSLLIWGDKDLDTPLKDAKIFEKLIPDSGLVVLEGAGHYSYLDKLGDFLVIISKFLEG